jgi:hypothetical protein
MGTKAQESVWGGALRIEIWGVGPRMDGWEIARKDRIQSERRDLLAFASAHLKGSFALLAGRARP